MQRRLGHIPLLVVTAAVAGCAGPAPLPVLDAACRVRHDADLAIRVVGRDALVAATLNGVPVLMKLDTGAEVSSIVAPLAARLGLPSDGRPERVLLGIGGAVRSTGVRVERFGLGTIPVHPQNLSVGGVDPAPGSMPPLAGVLGNDILAGRDVDLDLPDDRIGLTAVSLCPMFRPWAGAQGTTLVRTPRGLSFVMGQIDGHAVRALVDTGATTTVVSTRLAAALGVSEAALGADPVVTRFGISGRAIPAHLHRFSKIRVGAVTWTDVPVAVTALSAISDMFLGADLLGRQRSWISAYRSTLWLE